MWPASEEWSNYLPLPHLVPLPGAAGSPPNATTPDRRSCVARVTKPFFVLRLVTPKFGSGGPLKAPGECPWATAPPAAARNRP